MSGPVGFAETISTWMRFGSAWSKPAAVLRPGVEHVRECLAEPRGRQEQVQEPGTGDLGTLDRRERLGLPRELLRKLARRAAGARRRLEGDVRGVVAVLGLRGPLERTGRAGGLRQLRGKVADGVSGRQRPHPA